MVVLQKKQCLRIAMFCMHSHPLGRLGTTNTGGMSVYIRQVAFELGKIGHLIDIYTRFNGLYNDKVIEITKNVRLIQIEVGGKEILNRFALNEHIDEFTKGVEAFRLQAGIIYDVIHSHYWLSGLVGLWARDQWSTPLVVTFHTVAAVKEKLLEGFNSSEMRLYHEKKLTKSCDLVVSLTEFEKEELIKLYDGQRSTISVIQCGVDLETFHPVDQSTARRALGVSGKDMVLLYVGRLDPVKGLDNLLRALALLRQKVCCRLFIVGGDDAPSAEQEHLSKMMRELRVEECVTFAGSISQKELPLYYSAADVFVFPSYYESFGLAGMEALACGTPVVASDVGVYSQLLTNPKAGRVFPVASPKFLSEAIEEMIKTGQKHYIQADDIRKTIKHFTWKRVAKSLNSEYLRLVQTGRAKEVLTKQIAGL